MSSRTVLITGANGGVGYATTKIFATAPEKFHVIMAGRSLEKVDRAKAEIEAGDGVTGTLSTVQLDVTDNASIERAARQVQREFGKLDVLINNAGLAGSGVSDLKSRFQLVYETNVIGVAMVAHFFRPLLLQSGTNNAYSIYVTSGVGSLGMAADPALHRDGDEAYRSSKAAVNMLAVLESLDFGPKGVKTFAMCPGFVRSGLSEGNTAENGAEDPATSGRLALDLARGVRDADVGKVVRSEGRTWDW